ncbi:solute binding protein [Bordetella pertussis]|uniref:Exported solute binding protein n=3 Tax=Bordetella pertussis TaxID=520 RepID=Q7VUV7_BORPE|nr:MULTISPECIES: TRAP transporter substrate-binding protein [Bordetella]ETH40084.1 ABC transporter, substrate-binding protein, family 7 [Bordetella pertussis H918]ETH43446.1 ABC transporter, substrate-binding protein, family 7 [Bordetella pertussis H939]ETH47801.1 ABC transporter, substrate-binding protein, family 7 [Bordetella pertussis H921]ETH72062.1 ABC transporter, substrate-binding protein, family 7 [Bordetella pertussis STO1-CHLA-0011]ETH84324.1 ABC transporter, substrate-binding protei
MQRRSFLKHAGLGAVAGSAAVAAPVFAQDAPTLNWRMASSFPRSLDTLFGTGEIFVKFVSEATGGKFNIRQFPGGEIVPALQVMDAVSNNTIECGHTVSYYYYGKDPAYCFDSAVPFGLNARQMNAWMFDGDGMKLTREMFKPLKIVNFPMGNTGVQMGGWYRKEIKSPEDLKGLKMRTAGFAGEVLSRMGVVPQQLAGGDVYPSLEKGTLDAVEFVGPYDDEKLGFNKVAKYYYYPGWWEGGPQVSLYLNEGAWEGLPKSYQAIVEAASRVAHVAMTSRYDALNPPALRKLIAGGAELRAFPRSVMDASYEAALTVYKEFSDKDPKFKAIYENYMGFRDSVVPWFRLAEGSYDQYLGVAMAGRK